MKQRPIRDLVDALTANGVVISYLGTEGCLPIQIESREGERSLKGGKVTLKAGISSQYVSSILLSSPYAASEGMLVVIIYLYIFALSLPLSLSLSLSHAPRFTYSLSLSLFISLPSLPTLSISLYPSPH